MLVQQLFTIIKQIDHPPYKLKTKNLLNNVQHLIFFLFFVQLNNSLRYCKNSKTVSLVAFLFFLNHAHCLFITFLSRKRHLPAYLIPLTNYILFYANKQFQYFDLIIDILYCLYKMDLKLQTVFLFTLKLSVYKLHKISSYIVRQK